MHGLGGRENYVQSFIPKYGRKTRKTQTQMKDNIQVDLKESECENVDWASLDQDMASVRTVI